MTFRGGDDEGNLAPAEKHESRREFVTEEVRLSRRKGIRALERRKEKTGKDKPAKRFLSCKGSPRPSYPPQPANSRPRSKVQSLHPSPAVVEGQYSLEERIFSCDAPPTDRRSAQRGGEMSTRR